MSCLKLGDLASKASHYTGTVQNRPAAQSALDQEDEAVDLENLAYTPCWNMLAMLRPDCRKLTRRRRTANLAP